MKKLLTIATTIIASFVAVGAHAKTKTTAQKGDALQTAEKLDLKDYETGVGPNEPVKTFVCRSKSNS